MSLGSSIFSPKIQTYKSTVSCTSVLNVSTIERGRDELAADVADPPRTRLRLLAGTDPRCIDDLLNDDDEPVVLVLVDVESSC